MVRKVNNHFPFPQNEPESSNNGGSRSNEERSQAEQNNTGQNDQSQENPGLILVTTTLTGNNFLPWSKAIKRALIAKLKLRFITEDGLKP